MNTIYDLNKEIVKEHLDPLNHLELAKKQKDISEWFNWEVDCYAMLLCHERRDYTIFHMYENQNPDPPALAAKELMGCLTNRGTVLSIDETPDKAWEIWLKIDDECFCYYLFRYDEAVIEV